jgi:hypothetical protein
VCALLAALPLHAETRSDAVRRGSYEQGVAAMKSRNWRDALRIFRALWDEQKTYDVALMLGQINTNLERFRDAAEFLDYGIHHAVPRERPETLDRSRKLLEIAKSRVGTLEIRVAQPGAEIAIDGRVYGHAPLDSDVYVEPGARLVEATQPNASAVVRDTIEVPAGQRRVVVLEFPEAGAAGLALDSDASKPGALRPESGSGAALVQDEPSPALRGARRDATLPIVTGIAAGLAAIAGGALLLVAQSKDHEREELARQLPGTNACGAGQSNAAALADCQRVNDLADEWATLRTLSVASFGVAVVAAGVTTYLVWPRASGSSNTRVTLAPVPSPHGVSLHTGLSGSF